MTIETITGRLDEDNLQRINRNFETLNARDYEIMQDFLSADPTRLTPGVNGLEKPSELDMRNLNNYGINFRAGANGVIYKTSIYASSSGVLGVGLAEQSPGTIAGPDLYFKTINLRQGWNEVVLNFAIEHNKDYTLFRRAVENNISTAGESIHPWGSYPFLKDGIDHFYGGMTLDLTTTSRYYTSFFEIQVITSISQVYKIMSDSVKPPQQFYVGDNPPQDASFWFKPVDRGDS